MANCFVPYKTIKCAFGVIALQEKLGNAGDRFALSWYMIIFSYFLYYEILFMKVNFIFFVSGFLIQFFN